MPITIYPGTVKKRNLNGTYSDLVPGADANPQLANDIAEEYDPVAGVYSVGDYCIYQSVLYKCITAISTPEAFNSTKWTDVSVTDEIGGVKNTLNQLDQNMAYVESGNTASRTYAAGDFISWKGTLYTASAAIPLGDPFTVGTNLAAVVDGSGNLCGGLNVLNDNLTDFVDVKGTATTIPMEHFQMKMNNHTKAVVINGYAYPVSLSAGYKIFQNFISSSGSPLSDTAVAIMSDKGLVNAYVSGVGNLIVYSATAQSDATLMISGTYYRV